MILIFYVHTFMLNFDLQGFLSLLNSPDVAPSVLKEKFLELMRGHGISQDSLERGALVQAAAAAAKISAEEMQAVMEVQNALVVAGILSPEQVAEAFNALFKGMLQVNFVLS